MIKKDFHIISAFPRLLDSYYQDSILQRAQKKKLINIYNHDLRDYTKNKHRQVDDVPYGGGVGMVLQIEPIWLCWQKIRKKKRSKTILLTPAGERLNQELVKKLAKEDQLIFICGHYEGVDARVENFCDLPVSIGDYVLTGGELGAAVIIDAVTRLMPGVLGKLESTIDESHSKAGVLEYPQYTRPENFPLNSRKTYSVPSVLLSGNHQLIKEWREKNRAR
ncbi:MAG: tRNA (guanosine(37)-N1)-methyltransferase TrmD [Candidatus Komeilibacteria bacterium CG_4_10_14_0_2_um_filter_37_10]|uniref:tRNA (guanine-N(1)-)-methyltransferase n=1 Tax=Candidatus Komeilibacteria bacterium CG_4_10_14_0_2_um_filter_37_10 TaxID=1974470 RepID=A0A2M7VF43_9BACT|nr:MAG: tRNA (guanosine(37)-N1)-methyltransferase TrmD [Candidatus Komeilibacteria bacterium CG_4_10_14_0_2_um_filter_37_10]